MITFFRRIRKGLLDLSQVRKYLLYAMGEIALVVIGILIALQVNNWNEGRIEQNRILNYIKAIYADMLVEQEVLDRLIDRFRTKSEVSVSIMEILENPENPISDSIQILNDLTMLGGNVGINRKENTWDELRSTGKFQALDDKVLVEMLTNHYQCYDNYISNFNRLPLDKLDELKEIASSFHTSDSMKQLIKDGQFSSFPNATFEKFMTQEGLHNLISSIGVFSTIYNNFFLEVRKQGQSTLAYIEQEYPELLALN